jgi:carbonic anhydrase
VINPVDRLLLQNKAWAFERKSDDPAFFSRMMATQKPDVLWIGCSDSRVPANEVTVTGPGELFMHRNIASLVPPGDLNAECVIHYAVAVLKVEGIIVCGHRGCGGLRAAMSGNAPGPLQRWLEPIRAVMQARAQELAGLEGDAKENVLLEHVVRAQVETLSAMPVIQNEWRERPGPTLHAMVYDSDSGRLIELNRLAPTEARRIEPAASPP